jgi:hypothetical protein
MPIRISTGSLPRINFGDGLSLAMVKKIVTQMCWKYGLKFRN